MARDYSERELIKWTPSVDKESTKPTYVNFIPLTKGEYDKYIASLAEMKRNKVIYHSETAFEKLCKLTLTADSNGNYLGNVYWKEKGGIKKFLDNVNDKELAIKICAGMITDDANELEQEMRGQSSLTEEEVKN